MELRWIGCSVVFCDNRFKDHQPSSSACNQIIRGGQTSRATPRLTTGGFPDSYDNEMWSIWWGEAWVNSWCGRRVMKGKSEKKPVEDFQWFTGTVSCGCRSQWMIGQGWKWPFPTVFSDLPFSTLPKCEGILSSWTQELLQLIPCCSLCIKGEPRSLTHAAKNFSFQSVWAPIPGGSEHLVSRYLACTGAVPLPLHRDTFIISFPSHSCFPHDEILDNTTVAPEKLRTAWQRTQELFWHSHSARTWCCTSHLSVYLAISQLKHRECVCAHLHRLSPAAAGEVFCWLRASFPCWNSNKSWNSKKSSSTGSHKHAPGCQGTRNPGEFVTKEKLLRKRNQATQNFLMEWNQCKMGVLPLRGWKGRDCRCTFMC